MRHTVIHAVIVGLVSTAQPAQTPAVPTFDVVSITRNMAGDTSASVQRTPGGGLHAANATLRSLIRTAYAVQDSQVVDAPAWLDRDRFDIVATGRGGELSFDAMRAALRRLLAERFNLRVHEERRERRSYAMVLAREDGRLGPQLRISSIDCRPTALGGSVRPEPIAPPGLPPGEPPICGNRARRGLIMMGGSSLADLARGLGNMIGTPIIDTTGLSGTVDLVLAWDPDQTGGASLFTAVSEQLGLRLEPRSDLIDVLVVDSADRPREN